MYGDFSRVIDVRSNPYSAVLAQQGRFLLDAELNEQSAIVLDYLRRLTVDLIGPFGGPVHHSGFKVELVVEQKESCAVKLSPGHYYVHGLRCEAPWPGCPADEEIVLNEQAEPFVVYLVVWEETIGAIQAPELAEPALGEGVPDTTRRSQVRWHPRAGRWLPGSKTDLSGQSRPEIVEAFHRHNGDLGRRPRMSAQAHKSSEPDEGPSAAPADAAYRGVENQLYRVEVHEGGSAKEATFKWSRDNGSVELALDSLSTPNLNRRSAKLRGAWRDARSGVQVGDWVELVDDRWVPFGDPQPLMRVHEVMLFKNELTLEDAESERPFSEDRHPFLRRWDQDPEHPANAIPVAEAEGQWFELEDGVQVRFECDEAEYQRGDYWLIAARTATRGVLWPESEADEGEPLALAPHGPTRYLAPLAYVTSPAPHPADLRTCFARVSEVAVEADVGDQSPRQAGGDAQPPGEPVDDDQAPGGPGEGRPTALSPTMIVPPPARFRLLARSGFDPGVVFELGEGDTTVGRDRVSGVNIERAEISRHHAILTVEDGRLTLKDARSGNGTYVNGERRDDVTELVNGDVISFGTSVVQLEVERVEDRA